MQTSQTLVGPDEMTDKHWLSNDEATFDFGVRTVGDAYGRRTEE